MSREPSNEPNCSDVFCSGIEELPRLLPHLTYEVASAFVAIDLHHLLPHPPELILDHLQNCRNCRVLATSASAQLDEVTRTMRRLAGAPKLLQDEMPSSRLLSWARNLFSKCSSEFSTRMVFEREFEGNFNSSALRIGPSGGRRSRVYNNDRVLPKQSNLMNNTLRQNYAQNQQSSEIREKQLVAEWIVQNFSLHSGSGLFFDAGSQCHELWLAAKKNWFEKGQLTEISLFTANYTITHDWVEHERALEGRIRSLDVLGPKLDPPHRAFYGADRKRWGDFFPSFSFIGVSSLLAGDGEVFLGYHAGDTERDDKQFLFKCRTWCRVVLLTPSKIGAISGKAMNLLSDINGLDCAPIYFVTTAPEPGSLAAEALEKTIRSLKSAKTTKRLNDLGLTIHWVTLRVADDKSTIEATTVDLPDESKGEISK